MLALFAESHGRIFLVSTQSLSLYRFVRNMFTVSQFKYCVPGVKFGVLQELSWELAMRKGWK